MNDATKQALLPVWNRNPDLCDAMANVLERGEGWDEVVRLWGRTPPAAIGRR